MRTDSLVSATSAALLLGALPLIAAHGDEHVNMIAGASGEVEDQLEFMSYFRHGKYTGWVLGHIALMISAWVFAMPVAIMLSTARSRYHLPAQVVFHILNGLGIFTGFVYNQSTPDLWEHNSHHPLGWAVVGFTIAWTLISFFTAYSNDKSKQSEARPETMQFRRMEQAYMYASLASGAASPTWRDSGIGSRQNSSDSIFQKHEPMQDIEQGDDEGDDEPEQRGFLGNDKVGRSISRYTKRFSTAKATSIVRLIQMFLEKVLLLCGFAALASGFVIYGGLARKKEVFSVLAHFIKGGIFFWYGLLTLGRWMGAFTEFGWAWNIRPDYPLVERWKTRIPSAEFTESFVIWLYGASNVFLEHLGNAGGEWTPQDFEHVSITILFFGGGLLGMIIDSSSLRNLVNTPVMVQKSRDEELADGMTSSSRFGSHEDASDAAQQWEEPKTYEFPLNPMPALVIMLLGMMMSAHKQNSMVSTMMHGQWGGLFTGFALSRAATYLLMYLKPPTSHFSARPPTELVAAYCLSFGGIMFMLSSHDTVWAIESNGLDAMTVFTITAGLTGIILAWEVICFAIKGWASRKEMAAAGKTLPATCS
ncbi:putative membrane protein, partial [Teratosphaeria destructans]